MAKSLNKASDTQKHTPRLIKHEDLKNDRLLMTAGETVMVAASKNKKTIEDLMQTDKILNYVVSPSDKKDHFNVAVRDRNSSEHRIHHYSIKIDPSKQELTITENNSFFKSKSSSVHPLKNSPFTQAIGHLSLRHGSSNKTIFKRLQQKNKPEVIYDKILAVDNKSIYGPFPSLDQARSTIQYGTLPGVTTKKPVDKQLAIVQNIKKLRENFTRRYPHSAISVQAPDFGNVLNSQLFEILENGKKIASFQLDLTTGKLTQQASPLPPRDHLTASTPVALIAEINQALKKDYAARFHLDVKNVNMTVTPLNAGQQQQFNITANNKPEIQVILNQKDMQNYRDNKQATAREIPNIDVIKALETELSKLYQQRHKVIPDIKINLYNFGNKVQVDYTISYKNQVEHRQFSNETAASYLAKLTEPKEQQAPPPRGPRKN